MSVILKKASQEELIQANQRNLLAFNKEMSRDSDVVHYLQREGVEGLYSPLPAEFLNRVICTNLSADHFEKERNDIIQLYQRHSSSLCWEIWPTDTPPNREEMLKQNGFQYHRDYPTMSIPIDKIADEPLEGLDIRKVTDEIQAAIFAVLFQEIYGLPDSIKEDLLNTISRKGYDQDYLNYIGYVRGEPVCIASMFYGAGVAGIYNVGTKQEHSRKGYGSRVTAFPLLEAKKKGFEYAVLQSSDMAEKVYEQMGFEELCRVKVYKRG